MSVSRAVYERENFAEKTLSPTRLRSNSSPLATKEWFRQAKLLIVPSLENGLEDYNSDIARFLKMYDHSNLTRLLHSIHWMDKSFNSDTQTRTGSVLASKIRTVGSICDGSESVMIPRSESLLWRKANVSLYDHFILDTLTFLLQDTKFNDNFYTKLVNCFSLVFTRKYDAHDVLIDFYASNSKKSSFLSRLSNHFGMGTNSTKIKPKSLPNSLNNTNQQSSANTIKQAMNEIKEFSHVLTELVKLLLRQLRSLPYFGWTPQTSRVILEVVNKMLFDSNSAIYQALMILIDQLVSEKQAIYDQQIAKIKSLTPKDLNVRSKFYMESERYPFLDAIEALNSINLNCTPDEKFKSVCRARTELIRSIDSYMRVKQSNDSVIVSSEELLDLYTYLLSKSYGNRMIVNLYFIESLLDEQARDSGSDASCLTTLTAAVDYIISADFASLSSSGIKS